MIDLRFSTALQMVLGVALADKDDFRVHESNFGGGPGHKREFCS
jgi:hypothetical protein